MKILAAICGITIVLLGVWSTGRNPTEIQTAVEILCLVGGLLLCFFAVVIARLDALGLRLAVLEDSLAAAMAGPPDPAPVLEGTEADEHLPVPEPS